MYEMLIFHDQYYTSPYYYGGRSTQHSGSTKDPDGSGRYRRRLFVGGLLLASEENTS